jgi:hypothetical protein
MPIPTADGRSYAATNDLGQMTVFLVEGPT